MVINLGSVADVYRLTGRSSETLAESDVEAFLNEASREIRAFSSKDYTVVDEFFANIKSSTGATNKSYETYFGIDSDVTPVVYVNGVERTVSTDYTISGDVITFTSSYILYEGDKINVVYRPDFFDDMANYIASSNVYSTQVLDESNSVVQVNIENLQKKINNFKRTLNRKPKVATFVDHREDNGVW